MPRRMSVSLTLDAVRARTKTVTRRHVDTWSALGAGDRLTLIEKGMGLPKGARQVTVAEVEVVDVRVEQLGRICESELVREGFPDMSRLEFMGMWLASHGYQPGRLGPLEAARMPVRRIEWRYLDEAAA